MQQAKRKFIPAALYGLIAFTLTILCALSGSAQTFRGGINGTVTDRTGAAIANATVTAIQTDTGVAHDTVSSSAGAFPFQDLPLGNYSVTASSSGFQTVKTDKILVSAGTIYTLPI